MHLTRRLILPLAALFIVALFAAGPTLNMLDLRGENLNVTIDSKTGNDVLLVDATPFEYYYDDNIREPDKSGGEGTTGSIEVEFYRDALDANGYTYDEWTVFENWDEEFPPLTSMKEYEIIIWFYGDGYMYSQQQNPFLYEIPRYLDAGGKMLLCGNTIAPYVIDTAPDFMTDHIHGTLETNSTQKSVEGVDNDFIGDGFTFDIEGGDGADNNWGDTPGVFPRDASAQTAFETSGHSVGLRIKTSVFKLVYLSFNYESVADEPTRTLLMQRIMDYLKGRPTVVHTPLGDTEDLLDGYNVSAEIRGEGLNLSTLKVFYDANQSGELDMIRVGATDKFFALIPAQPINTTVYYYVTATNIEMKTTTSPKNMVWNDTATHHEFFVGPDVKPPVIVPGKRPDTVRTDEYQITAVVTDNLGVDPSSVNVHYRHKGDTGNFTAVKMGYYKGGYSAAIPGAATETVFEYYFTAKDLANTPNEGRHPDNGTLQFAIVYHRLLLLDNSNSDSRISDYKDALTGVGYWNWSVKNSGYPTDFDLLDYSDIIWVLGTNLPSGTAQDLMGDFMDNGGKIFLGGTNLFSYDYYEESTTDTFIEDYFYVEEGNYYWAQSILGVPGDPIGEGIDISAGGQWGGFSGQALSVLDEQKAFPCLLAKEQDFWGMGGGSTQTVGVRVEADAYKAVLFSFEIGSASGTETEELLSNVLEWLDSPFISHTPLKDTEDVTGPYGVKAMVTDDDLRNDQVMLYYKINSQEFETKVMTQNAGEFTASIDGPGAKADIYYYIEAKDKSSHVTLSPGEADQGKLETMNMFHVGPDEIAPVITHKPLGDNVEQPHYYVNITVTDNMGVNPATVLLYYKLNDEADFKKITFTNLGDAEYTAKIPGQTQGTTVYYYIEAKDGAVKPNLASMPGEGAYSFTVFDKIPVLILDGSWDIFGDILGSQSPADAYRDLLDKMGVTYHYVKLEESFDFDDDYIDDDIMIMEGNEAGTRQDRREPAPDPDGQTTNNETIAEVDVELLSKYNMVIYLPAVFNNNWDPILGYLDQGGKLFIANGYFIAESFMGSNEFLEDYVGISMKGAAQDSFVAGVKDDPISNDLNLELETLGQTTLALDDDSPAIECYQFSDGVAGVRVDDPDYRIVVFSFNMEDIANESVKMKVFEKVYSWLNGIPQIIHTPHPDTENTNGPYKITAKILDDDLNTDDVELIYSAGTEFKTVKMTAAGEDNYTAGIPGQIAGTRIFYYIKVSDGSFNIVSSPFTAIEADTNSLYTFYIGEDKTKPVIDAQRLPNSVPREYYLLKTVITDNLGLDMNETFLYYKLSTRSSYERASFITTGEENEYVGAIPGNEYKLGDAIEYYIEARDQAKVPNTARLPVSGTLNFKIVDKNVLLVDDDLGMDLELIYKSFLLDNGYAFDHHDMALEGGITGQKLMGYSAVVWFCSDAQMGTISEEEAEAMSYYLDRGGNVLLMGNHIAFEAANVGWNLGGIGGGFDDDFDGGDRPEIPFTTRQDKTTTTDEPVKDDGTTKDEPYEKPPPDDDKPTDKPPVDDEPWIDDDDYVDDETFTFWLGQYFKVFFGEYGYGDIMKGASHTISRGLDFQIASPGGIIGGFLGTTDVLKLDTDGQRVFSTESKSRMNNTGAAYAGSHRSLYYSFGIHDILNESIAETVLTRSIDWLYEGAANIKDSDPFLTVFGDGRTEVKDLTFNFTVDYTDNENDIPQGVFCVLDGKKYEMTPVDITDQDYTDGKTYFVQLKFQSGTEFKYHFESPGANKTESFSFSTGFIGSTGMLFAVIAGILLILIIAAIVVFIFFRNRKAAGELDDEELEEETGKKTKVPKARKKPKKKGAPLVAAGELEKPGKNKSSKKGKGSKKGKNGLKGAADKPKKLPEGKPKALDTGSKCPSCNKSVSLDSATCPHCKTDLDEGLECPKCHGGISENDTRCPHCGVRFG